MEVCGEIHTWTLTLWQLTTSTDDSISSTSTYKRESKADDC